MGMELKMHYEKETPGAVRYYECDDSNVRIKVGQGAKIGTLYIRKEAFLAETTPPRTITVTIDD